MFSLCSYLFEMDFCLIRLHACITILFSTIVFNFISLGFRPEILWLRFFFYFFIFVCRNWFRSVKTFFQEV